MYSHTRAKKLILASSCLPVSLHVRVKQLIFQRTDFCDILYTETFYYNSVEKIQIALISDKNIRHFTCDFELLLGQTTLGASTANTGTGKRRLLRSGKTGRLSLCTCAHTFLCISFVQAVVKRQSCRPSNAATFSSPRSNHCPCAHCRIPRTTPVSSCSTSVRGQLE
jgi:hypothetical protein